MADSRSITSSKASTINSHLEKASSFKKPSQKAVDYFNAQSALKKNHSTSLARDAIANKLSGKKQEAKQVDKSKYNDVLRDYNTQAAQNNCKGQCHGYEAGFEEETEFNTRMQKMHKLGYAPKGHALTYRETNWWWKFGNGDDLWVDGNMIKPMELSNRTIASPFPRLDDLKVLGSLSRGRDNPERVHDDSYDFDHQNVAWDDFLGHTRNFLNKQAIKEHGSGTPFKIKFDYGDRGKVQ